ncbi:MAG: hypothetical protein V3V53_16950 [Bacteroidales bacterium]|jgi:hypothetical protein
MKARGVFYFGKFIVMGVAFLALFTYVVMLLWNWLVPELFSGPILTYWQTLGILVLSKILLSGLGHGHKDRPPWRSKDHYWSHRHPSSLWRKKFEEKMNGKVADEQNQQEGSKDGCC